MSGKFKTITKRYIGVTIFILFSLLLLTMFFVIKCCFTPSYNEALPSDAKVINEYRWGGWFSPDYCYYLKMKISYESFLLYKGKKGFIILPEEKYSIFDFGGFDNQTDPWWNPKDEPNQVYFNPSMKGSQKAFMKYEDGYLYYKESAGF